MENFKNLYSENDILIDRKERIGKGIFGDVYKATIKNSNKRVAVKIILVYQFLNINFENFP